MTPLKVLIVDDNDDDRKLLRMIFQRHGCCEILEGRDGQEGLELARAHRPDLIVSDAMMPRMDGFEFMRSVKIDPQLKSVPFVFHSSVYTGSRDEELANRLGADAFIAKPIEPDRLWKEIEAILARPQGARAEEPDAAVTEESQYLREYSEVVSAKLEEKVRELEESLARQKLAEEALRERERFLQKVVENIPALLFVKDARELRYLLLNRAGEKLMGYGREEMAGHTDAEIFPDGHGALMMEQDRAVIGSGRMVEIKEETVFAKDGREVVLHTRKIPVVDALGQPQYLLGISEDITERRRSEEELLKLSSAIEQSPVAVVITDAAGTIEFVNPKFTELTGYPREEALGKNPRLLAAVESTDPEQGSLWDTIDSGQVWHGEVSTRRKSGDFNWQYATVSPVKNRQGVTTHHIAVLEDITEMKKLEMQLRHAQKMEAVGTLAAGIAHDFNNILTAIIGFANIMEMKMPKDNPLSGNVTQILSAAERAANLTRSLLAFGRAQPMQTRHLDLNEIVVGLTNMLRRLLREDVELCMELCPGKLPIVADGGQIEQVLLNLATNARDAMACAGAITIVTEVVELGPEFLQAQGYGRAGTYALLRFSDSGKGMEDGVLQRIFEPFFTTKEVGKGTGLGLSICYSIIKQHGGYISCQSRPGEGTSFLIHLPLTEEVAEPVELPDESVVARGTETILIAEDDLMVRELTVHILTDFGYRVIEAADGEQAVALFREHMNEIDLLLLDAIMPKKNGWDTFQEMKALRPGARALLVSGYQADRVITADLAAEGAYFLAKPAAPRELLKKVREVLDARAS